eukprot:GILI01009333.1.p1 GENE.GILI01009333.1~~GILI01009333.1.p1  ORF type:complete len:799 (-),score=70.37 GILI01009333.1:23-2419(-)
MGLAGIEARDPQGAPTLPADPSRPHAPRPLGQPPSYSNFRDVDPPTRQPELEVVDYPEGRGLTARNLQPPAPLLPRGWSHQPYLLANLGTNYAAPHTPNQGRETKPAHTSEPGAGHEGDTSDVSHEEGNLDSSAVGLAHSISTRLRTAVELRGPVLQQQQVSQRDVSPRQRSPSPGSIHGPLHHTASGPVQIPAGVRGDTASEVIQQDHHRHQSEGRSSDNLPRPRTALHPQRSPPGYGEERSFGRNSNVLLRAYKGGNLAPLPKLELGKFQGGSGNAGSGRYPFSILEKDPNVNFCPSFNDLRPRNKSAQYDHLKIHAHDGVCSALDVPALKLMSGQPSTMSHLLEAIRWTEDPNKYNFQLPPLQIHPTRLTPTDINRLNDVGKFVFAQGLCGLQSFGVPELAKERRRAIMWPDINASISKDMLQDPKIPMKAPIREQVKKNSWSMQFDFKSWFDQIPLSQQISKFFAFDTNWCLGQLPMGFRPAVEVAQAITLLLIDFTYPPGVEAAAYIDNVRFVGPTKTAVAAAGDEFVRRCASVNAIIGSSSEPSQEDTFLGESYNYRRATRANSKKTLEKLTYVKESLNKSAPLTYRQIAAIFGLLFFASDVAATRLAQHFNSLTFYRRSMTQVKKWSAVGPTFPEEVRLEVVHWIDRLLINTPVPASKPPPPPTDLEIYVDASDYGWGCVSFHNNIPKVCARPWSASDREVANVSSSVTSEPLGALRAVLATVSTSMRRVVIHTDHTGLVYAGNRGYGKAKTYNEALVQLQKFFPTTDFVFQYIPGPQNPADPYSRGQQIN